MAFKSPKNFRQVQKLVVQKLSWRGKWVTCKVLDEEEAPRHVCISNVCFGDTGGWLSKFAPFNRDGTFNLDKLPRGTLETFAKAMVEWHIGYSKFSSCGTGTTWLYRSYSRDGLFGVREKLLRICGLEIANFDPRWLSVSRSLQKNGTA